MRTPAIPNKDEVIQLHGLLQKANILGRKINFSLNMALSNFLFNVTVDYFFDYLFSNYGEYLIEPSPFALLGASGLIYGSAYSLYKGVSSVTSYFLPYGMGVPSAGIEYKNVRTLLTREKAHKLLNQLKNLTEIQQSRINKMKILSWAATIFLPFLSLISLKPQKGSFQMAIESFQISLGAGAFGPYIYLKNFKKNVSPLIFNTVTSLQGLHYLSYIYNKCDNYNLPAQIKTFQLRLNHLSYFKKGWEIQNPDAEKSGVMIALEIPGETLNFTDEHQISRKITTAFYTEILHRVLISAGVTAYALSEHILYAGISKLTQKAANKARVTLLKQLITVSNLEELSWINLKRLNEKINPAAGVHNNDWQIHFEFDSKTSQYQLSYFTRKQGIPEFIRAEYLNFLNKILPEKNIIQDHGLIKLTELPKKINRLNTHLNQLIRAYELKITENQPLQHPTMKLGKLLRTLPKRIVSLDEKKSTSLDYVLPELPASLAFRGGYQFFSPQPKVKPENYAHPILLPWLPQGSAFVCIDVAVFATVKEFVSKDHIVAQLERGALHSAKEGFGIQTKIQRYKGCDGKLYTSSLQMKFNNNIGIFAHKFQTVQAAEKRYELHRFNGPGFRH